VFGDSVRDIRFFRFGHFDFQGRDLVMARSGYSKQGGFEIYVEGAMSACRSGMRLMEAGAISMCACRLPERDRADRGRAPELRQRHDAG
jgi:glycine cleavage system aminomethyltransferase T